MPSSFFNCALQFSFALEELAMFLNAISEYYERQLNTDLVYGLSAIPVLCSCGFPLCWRIQLCFSYAISDHHKKTKDQPVLQSFNNSCLIFFKLWFFFEWRDMAIYIGCCKWSSHRKTKYWSGLWPFNNSCLIFIAADVDFALEPDASLTEWDLGAIDKVVGSNKEGEASL